MKRQPWQDIFIPWKYACVDVNLDLDIVLCDCMYENTKGMHTNYESLPYFTGCLKISQYFNSSDNMGFVCLEILAVCHGRI